MQNEHDKREIAHNRIDCVNKYSRCQVDPLMTLMNLHKTYRWINTTELALQTKQPGYYEEKNVVKGNTEKG